MRSSLHAQPRASSGPGWQVFVAFSGCWLWTVSRGAARMQRSARSPSDCAVPPGQDGQAACRTSGWRSEATPIPTRSTRTTAETTRSLRHRCESWTPPHLAQTASAAGTHPRQRPVQDHHSARFSNAPPTASAPGNTRGLPTTPMTTRPVDNMNNTHDAPTRTVAHDITRSPKHQCTTG